MDDQKTQTDQQEGPLIETMKDGSGIKQEEAADDGMLHASIKAPEKTLFEGPVESMTSKNKNGTFDILPYHENFISIIEDKVTIREKGKPPQEIKVGNAILKVSKNQANIFIGMEALVPSSEAIRPIDEKTGNPLPQPSAK